MTGLPCGSNPHHRLTPGDAQAVADFRDFLIARSKEKTVTELDAVRAAVLDEQGPEDQETLGEAAAMYRSLRPHIERTMTDPDRWDGDEDEAFHLARYVEWLAAEREQVRSEVLIEAADKLDRIGHGAAAFILRDDASRPPAASV
ncbi:hypothetical protein ACPESV_24590 [Streptomyces umbrinus]|uniref:hypothetical protein n=1 Tax=Streptomyces umbrinus TaxID=67370 RepID=UPI003C3086A7